MAAWIAWQVLYLVVILAVPYRRMYRGKILTMPIRRRIRFFAPTSSGYQGRDVRGFYLRGIQVLLAWPLDRVALHGSAWALCIAYFVDDWATGDDDRWKRFKDRVRNRVKWLMALPVPVSPETA